MTRAEVAALVLEHINEDVTSSALVTSTQLNTRIDIANKKVWREAVKVSQSYFVTRTAELTYPGNGSYDLTTVTPAGVYLITNAQGKFFGYWRNLTPKVLQDRIEFPSPVNTIVWPSAYYLEGDTIWLDPLPSGSVGFRVWYVPRVSDLALDGDVVLGGKLPDFHALVAYETAIGLGVKDEADPKGTIFLRDEMYRQMKQYLARRQSQEGRAIRDVGF